MHILIINRYSDDFADYARYVDHTRHRVSYVTIADHVPMIPPGTGHVEVVEDVRDADSVVAAASRCHAAAGALQAVLAPSEFDLLTAALVREKLGVPGPDTEATLLFRDKLRMKAALSAAGVRVPRFRAVRSPEDVVAFAAEHPGPVVAKPRGGAASVGCFIIAEGEDPRRVLADQDLSDYEAEEFVEGPIWHVDGLRHRGEDVFTLSSRYLDTCHGFSQGRWLGSAVQEGPEAAAVSRFAARCLDILGLTDGPYHLEVIEHRDGPVFLEVGARVGGGEIPFVVRDVYAVDLFADWFRIALGEPPAVPPTEVGGTVREYAGFLMLPEPVGSTLLSRTPLLGKIPHLYAEDLPEPGHVFSGDGGYENILGRFRFRASSPQEVEEAIVRTVDAYRYELSG